MYAILRQYTYDIAKIAHAEEALTVAQGLHAASPATPAALLLPTGSASSPSTSGGRRTTRRQHAGRSARKCSGSSSR